MANTHIDQAAKIPQVPPDECISETTEKILPTSSTLDSAPQLDDDGSTQHRAALSRARRVVVAGLMITPYFLTSSNSASAFMLIPSIQRDLGGSQLAVQWVASAYTLANGCGLLVSGRLADMYGRKKLFLIGMCLNGVFCLASGFIRILIPLCILRALAGLGLAIAMPAGFGIIGSTFDQEPGRTIAFAIMGTGWPLGSGVSQVLGAFIATARPESWSYIFVLLGGLAIVTAAVTLFVIPMDKDPKRRLVDRRIDMIGAVLITLAISLLSFSITQGGLVHRGWREPYIPCVFCLSIITVLAFGLWQHHLKRKNALPPLVDLDIFTRFKGKITALLAVTFTSYTAINGWLYVASQWFQVLKGETPLEFALHTLTAPIMGLVACLIVPLVAVRVRAPILLVFGCFSTAAACWLFAAQPSGSTYWSFEFIANIVNPWGADFTVGIGSVLISNFAIGDEQSLLGALFQTVIAFSGTIGTCLASLIQTKQYESSGDIRKSLDAAWWFLAGMSWLACLITIAFLRDIKLAKDVKRDLAHLDKGAEIATAIPSDPTTIQTSG
ncbi:major facilitator superfamily domain-containing protein [Kockovaella imperatae]|uniref:Major facilitator superfamily domain-containing protein n=1 Tax=Kockovaella imperatae TaxID=4999 RepID=A0A1Y1UTC5_9TREE|nr:major facilitator superfamily domain-containing protein [Kockovaella imperatae]ORX41202.1 major facilitator superfamily domain-containing protein [Kockovaella imperatae]